MIKEKSFSYVTIFCCFANILKERKSSFLRDNILMICLYIKRKKSSFLRDNILMISHAIFKQKPIIFSRFQIAINNVIGCLKSANGDLKFIELNTMNKHGISHKKLNSIEIVAHSSTPLRGHCHPLS